MDTKKASEIAELAKIVRESLELDVPVDVVEAVKRLGGSLKEVPSGLGGPEATVRRKGERFEITLREHPVPARKRFSVAHEIGHLLLHMGYLIDPQRWDHSSEYQDSVYNRFGHGVEENEANAFAAAFLMPAEQFRHAVAELGGQAAFPVKQLALRFKTSASAALRRGEELGILRFSANGHR